jgi:exonuclease VII large subunit
VVRTTHPREKFQEIREKIKAKERERTDEIERTLRKQLESQIAAVKASHEAELAQRLTEQRESLEKAKTEAVLSERAKTFEDNQKLQAKVNELQRQLEHKTAAELGEGAELDLFEVLKAAYENDRIRRVAKGTPGADIGD